MRIKRPGAAPETYNINQSDRGDWYVDSWWRQPRPRLLFSVDDCVGDMADPEPSELVRDVMRERYGIDLVTGETAAAIRIQKR